jgi:citrate synthase
VVRSAHIALEDDRMSLSNEAVRGSAPAEDIPQLAVQDSRTGRAYQVPIREGSVRAIDLRQIRTGDEDFGLVSYDPGFLNTACCRSAITYIDGDRGILLYRGYPIEQIAGHARFLDVAYLVLYGELPTAEQSSEFQRAITQDSTVPEGIVRLIESFPRDAHPMTILLSAVGALNGYHPEAKNIDDPAVRQAVTTRLIGSFSTLAGLIYRHVTGRPVRVPEPRGDFARDFLCNLYADGPDYSPPQAYVDAIEVLFILHADHEQNCSTNAVRSVGSSLVDPYSAMAAGVAALFGPLHGGANEAVLRMLREIGSVDRVPAAVEEFKAGRGRLMGFGHRVYKNYDPRARIIKSTADRVFEVTGINPLLQVAVQLESVALADRYFIDRRLYPNVDFYSGLIYEALGLPVGMYPVMFAAARIVGWTAQWLEMMADKDQKLARPLQIYVGPGRRDFPTQH